MPNWAEQVTAIATRGERHRIAERDRCREILRSEQVREARIGRQAQMAADFFRRWNEGPLVETRPLSVSSTPKKRCVMPSWVHL